MKEHSLGDRGAVWARKVALACGRRGLALTPSREGVLEILAASDVALGAYAIIEALSRREGRPIAPPTVYRALEFFRENGFLHKIESRNLYAPCDHVGHAHDVVMLLCETCGRSEEAQDSATDAAIEALAARTGFVAKRRMLEVQGLCRRCAKAA